MKAGDAKRVAYRNALMWAFDRLSIDHMTEAMRRRTAAEIGKVLCGKSSPAAIYEPAEWSDSTIFVAHSEDTL